MRLTVLGGSAAGPNAGAGCSGYLIATPDSAIVLDLGPGTLPELKRHINPGMLDGIVISHGHLDHILDLATLRYSLKYSPILLPAPLPVWIPAEASETLFYLARAFSTDDDVDDFFTGVLNIRIYDPTRPLTLGAFTIEFAPGVHYAASWAMRVTETGTTSSIGYTADTGPSAPLHDHLDGVSVLIAEAAAIEIESEAWESRGHLTATEAGELATRCRTETLLLTHLWEELGFDHQRADAARAFRGKVEIARPGLMLNV